MERVLNLAGKNSSEIFQLRYPYSMLTFCDYDLSYFAENAIAVCDEALRSGTLDADRATDLRNSLKNMHVWIEHNLRTVYDKIVLDRLRMPQGQHRHRRAVEPLHRLQDHV